MRVLKRDGVIEIVSFDKILRRIKTIGQEVGIKINYTQLTMKVIDQDQNRRAYCRSVCIHVFYSS